MSEDQIKVAEFDVKPGGMVQTHAEEWDDFKCTFTYTCQGGTNEKWVVGITRNTDQTEYSCVVERRGHGGKSYLFFQEFHMKVEGVQLKEADVESEQGVDLKPEEYSVNYDKNSVEHVKEKFQSQLSKLEVYGTRAKQEL